MLFHAKLRLPSTTSQANIEKRVLEICDELGLQKVLQSYIGDSFVRGLSGKYAAMVIFDISTVLSRLRLNTIVRDTLQGNLVQVIRSKCFTFCCCLSVCLLSAFECHRNLHLYSYFLFLM